MKKLKPNRQRADIAIILIWITLVLEILFILSNYIQFELLNKKINGHRISRYVMEINNARQQLIALMLLIVSIVSSITFIQWFRRAYYNLHIKVKKLSYSEGWAAGSWFVPIINLFLPYQIMKEIYVETKKLMKRKASNLSVNILGSWWILWILNIIIKQIILFLPHKTTGEILRLTNFMIIGNIATIPLALITIKIIKDYTKVEPLLYDIDDHLSPSENENKLVCLHCNTSNVEDAKFCKNCGKDLRDTSLNYKRSISSDKLLLIYISITFFIFIFTLIHNELTVNPLKLSNKYIRGILWIIKNLSLILIPLSIKNKSIKNISLVLIIILVFYRVYNNIKYLIYL